MRWHILWYLLAMAFTVLYVANGAKDLNPLQVALLFAILGRLDTSNGR